jgi:ethanolamine utilization protein EutN
MFLARVVGNVVASQKYEGMEGFKLMLIQPLDDAQEPKGPRQVAVDCVQAGEGDKVTCVGSREAALACEPTFVPVDCAIIGIIDAIDETAGA